MRLVIVTHAYPRHPADLAGLFLAPLSAALVRRGHTVTVVAPADRGTAARFSHDGVEVQQVRYAAARRETLAYTGRMVEGVRSLAGLHAFRGLLRALADGAREAAARTGADLIHAFWWVPSGWAASRIHDPPVIVTLMGTDVALLHGLPARLLGRRVLRRVARVTAISHYLAAEARRRTWLRDLDVDVLPVPASAGRFSGHSAGGGGIATLGRLAGQKRLDLLLEAVHHAGLRIPVTIVGDGPARPALERRARALGLDQVRFLGALPDEAVPGAIGNADVFAFLSRHEGLGLAAAEALMLGIPVVATRDGGGVLDLVDDGAGARVVDPTPAAVGAALRDLLHDPGARAAARVAGDALRSRLDPAGVAAGFETIYAGMA